MRDKIKARLKEKFSGVNLSTKRLDEISDKLSKKITEESEIDAKLDELNDIMPFADIAKQDDRIRTLEAKPKDKENPSDNSNQQQNGGQQQQNSGDEMPGWFKRHVEETNRKIAAIEAKNAQGSMQSRREKDLKDIDPKFYARIPLPEKEDEYDSYIEGIKTDWKDFSDRMVEKGLLSASRPVNGSGGNQSDKAIEDDIAGWAKAKSAGATTTTTT